jgi:hypothetical protein
MAFTEPEAPGGFKVSGAKGRAPNELPTFASWLKASGNAGQRWLNPHSRQFPAESPNPDVPGAGNWHNGDAVVGDVVLLAEKPWLVESKGELFGSSVGLLSSESAVLAQGGWLLSLSVLAL